MVNNKLAKLLRGMCDTHSPAGLLLMMAVSIFVIEILVMVVIHNMPFHDEWEGIKEALLDASFLVALLSPFFYYFFFRPLLRTIEERRRTEEALQAERNRLETVAQNVGAGLAIISKDYRTLWSNSIIRNMFGDVAGKPCYSAYNRQHTVCSNCGAREIFEKGKDKVVYEQRGTNVDGKTVWSQIIATPIRDEGGNVTAVLELVVPITERKKAEEALQLERNRLKRILDAMEDGVCIINRRRDIEYINPVLERTFGPVVGRKCYAYFHHNSDPCPWCRNEEVLAGGRTIKREWRSPKTGKIYDLLDTPIISSDGTVGKIELFHDVTERKRTEESLRESEKQLRHLSTQLLSAQEKERRRISRELHDELGQALSLMKLQLRTIENRLHTDQAELRQDCEHTLRYLDQVIDDVRRLSRDLSPAVLENHGLTSALRWLVDNFARSHVLTANLETEGMDLDSLFPRDSQTHVYRIVQEALTNIGKHARARNAWVVASKHGGNVFFLVADDGRGFDAGHEVAKNHAERGLGLSAMEERVRMLGGRLELSSERGNGTRIAFTVPVSEAKENVHESVSDRPGG